MKSQIIGDLRKIIPSGADDLVESRKVAFLSDLLEEVDRLYPKSDMDVVVEYLRGSSMFSNSPLLPPDHLDVQILFEEKFERIPSYYYCASDSTDKRINIDFAVQLSRPYVGRREYIDIASRYQSSHYELTIHVPSTPEGPFRSSLLGFADLYREVLREKEEVFRSYQHIVETSTTLGKLVEVLPELRDGLHRILNKFTCGTSSDEDETMRKILEYREKNNIRIE